MPTFPTNATFTPRLQLPRPGLDDPADGPDAFNDLTDVLDPIGAVFAQGTAAARPAATVPGRFYWATDTRKLSYSDGTAWVEATATTPAASALPVLDVGMAGQIRAGRQLTAADFTTQGLAAPLGLWNLSDLTDASGNARALANKGAVPFGVGINGLASTAAVFAGSTGQALYIPDTGASDPFRIKTGSWGCWFRTAKRATVQRILAKLGSPAGTYAYNMTTGPTFNNVGVEISFDGSTFTTAYGVSDVSDDRWHFAVATHDGTALRLYVDGVLEASTAASGAMFASAAPLNIGAYAADGSTAAINPCYGRIDEAFITADVLTDDQIRNLYCAKLAHTLGVTPTRVSLNVRRRRRGGILAVTDFPAQPVRLHNFTAGALTDEGSGGIALTAQGTAPISVAGADGAPGSGFSFGGAGSLASTDAGLPATTAARSYGAWFKTTTTAAASFLGWGTAGSADARLGHTGGTVFAASAGDLITGPYVCDGQWHLAVEVEDNAAGDGVRRKLYLDGRLVGGSTVLNSITLAGANRFRVGAGPDGSAPFTGQIDGAFVSAQALTFDQVAALYAKGTQALTPSPKNAGDHVEALDAASILATFDTLDSTAQVDLGVAA